MESTSRKRPQTFVSIAMDYKSVHDSIRYLDLYSRLLIGQYNCIPEMMGCGICGASHYPEMRKALLKVRKIFIPTLARQDIYSSHGIWSPNSPERAIKAYDVQQALRFQMAWHAYVKDGSTRSSSTTDFKTPYFHGNWVIKGDETEYCHDVLSAFQYPDYHNHCSLTRVWSLPCVIAEYNDDDKMIRVDISNEYYPEILQIMMEAQKVYLAVRVGMLPKAFKVLYPEVDVAEYENLLNETSRIIEGTTGLENLGVLPSNLIRLLLWNDSIPFTELL